MTINVYIRGAGPLRSLSISMSRLEKKLETFFSDLPFSQDAACVVVEVLPQQGAKVPPSSRPFTMDGDMVWEACETYLRASSTEKPSTTAIPLSFFDRQKNDCKAIPCSCPRKYKDRIPTVLLHPVFGQFIDDTKEIEVSAEDNKLVVELADAMSDLYKNKSEQIDNVGRVLMTFAIHFSITIIKRTGYETDGDMAVKYYHYVIAEFKNEAGNTSGEPYFQSIGYYLESTRKEAVTVPSSPLPCFLLSFFGPYVIFAGATWNLRPMIQLLSMPIAFNIHSMDTDNLLVLARHMAAFRKATQMLKRYYEDLRPTQPLQNMPSPQLFPYPTMYTFIQQLKNKLVFFSTESAEGSAIVDRICIKFAQRYSPDAHKHCTSVGCAPTLRGFEKIPGGWFMIVMDDLSNNYETLENQRVPIPTKSLIRTKLAEFLEEGFVHGDIRDTNIMVSKSDNMQFRIIDFDWAGIAGEVKYPAFLNPEVWRPEGASDGKPILAEHDDAMLNDMR
ncbi:hypothetical protein EDC04DRAFT_2879030 [Pisolithus marmoratus]|nr:hypothetical protein EDC04DRAFT_2879030 [Pisolithus marmoratus]